jgi:putative lipase involved disintegration of autophagic bodies
MYRAADAMVDRVEETVKQIRAQKEYAGYGLVVTGHSLGAGVASLLTLILRSVPFDPYLSSIPSDLERASPMSAATASRRPAAWSPTV